MTDAAFASLVEPQLSVRDWIVAALLLLIVIFGLRNLPRIWRHELRTYDEVNAYWPWGEAPWRGWVRAMPLSVVWLALVFPLAGLGAVIPEEPAGPFVRPLWWVLPTLGAFALFGVLFAGVVLFNRPRAIVAPHLRTQSGAVEERRRARRRAR